MENKADNQYDINNEPLVISKSLIDLFLGEKNTADLIALYTFYYYTAKWQKTNQPKAIKTYCKKCLKISNDRLKKAHDILLELGVIEDIVKRKENGQVSGHYVRVKFVWSKYKIENIINENLSKVPHAENATCGTVETNALSVNSLNALSLKNKNTNVFLQQNKFAAEMTNGAINEHTDVAVKNQSPKDPIPEAQSPEDQSPKDQSPEDSMKNKIQEVFKIFYESINPTITFGNTTQRTAAEELIKRFGFEEVKKLAEVACSVHGKKYAPVITNPYQLKTKLSELGAYIKRQEDEGSNIVSI